MDKKRIFRNGVLEEVGGRLIQMGDNCQDCGKIGYPVFERCIHCGSENTVKTPLSQEGVVYSFSVTRVPVGKYKPPIIGAFIDLLEGPRIYGQIKADLNKIKVGMSVEVEIGAIWTEEEGGEVVGYYFIPKNGEVL